VPAGFSSRAQLRYWAVSQLFQYAIPVQVHCEEEPGKVALISPSQIGPSSPNKLSEALSVGTAWGSREKITPRACQLACTEATEGYEGEVSR
jgi:hypothetical protein